MSHCNTSLLSAGEKEYSRAKKRKKKKKIKLSHMKNRSLKGEPKIVLSHYCGSPIL